MISKKSEDVMKISMLKSEKVFKNMHVESDQELEKRCFSMKLGQAFF